MSALQGTKARDQPPILMSIDGLKYFSKILIFISQTFFDSSLSLFESLSLPSLTLLVHSLPWIPPPGKWGAIKTKGDNHRLSVSKLRIICTLRISFFDKFKIYQWIIDLLGSWPSLPLGYVRQDPLIWSGNLLCKDIQKFRFVWSIQINNLKTFCLIKINLLVTECSCLG